MFTLPRLVRQLARSTTFLLLILSSAGVLAQSDQSDHEKHEYGVTFARLESEAIRVVTEYDDGVVLTARRMSNGGITASSTDGVRRVASLSVSPEGELRVRVGVGDTRLPRTALIGTAIGVRGKTAAWANDQLFLLLREANEIPEPLPVVLARQGDFFVLPGQSLSPQGKNEGRAERSPRVVTTYFPDYVAKSVTHPQGNLNSEVPTFTSALVDARTDERVGALRWSSVHEILQWKIDGKPSTVLAESLPERWTFTPTPEWANVQLYSLARVRENERHAAAGRSANMQVSDEVGCDGLHWLDDTIFRACCDQHDKCFAKNGCTYRSWWFDGSWKCVMCNMEAILCFSTLGLTSGEPVHPWVQDWNVEPQTCGGLGFCPAYCYQC